MVQRVETGQLWYYPETTVEILDGSVQMKCLIRFVETGEVKVVRAECIRRRRVRSNLTPRVKGVGFIGVGDYSYKYDKVCYQHWSDMFKRCYSKDNTHKAYFGVSVCSHWHNFQNFATWYYSQSIISVNVSGRLHLDKDLTRSKIYSPTTVHLIPESINGLLTAEGQHRRGYVGVSWHKSTGKWCATCRGVWLGVFDDELSAHLVYREYLGGQHRQLAEDYKGVISNEAYELLKNRKLYEGELKYIKEKL